MTNNNNYHPSEMKNESRQIIGRFFLPVQILIVYQKLTHTYIYI